MNKNLSMIRDHDFLVYVFLIHCKGFFLFATQIFFRIFKRGLGLNLIRKQYLKRYVFAMDMYTYIYTHFKFV